MGTLTKKLHILRTGGAEETCSIYTTQEEVGGSPYLALNVDGQRGYVKLGNTTDARATHLRVKKDNTTYAAWTNYTTDKPQTYIAEGTNPWYDKENWKDKSRIISVDTSVSGKAIVTCKGVTNMAWMFLNCSNITSLDMSNFNTSDVTTMRMTFGSCKGLTSLDVSSFDTSKVTDMWGMFMSNDTILSLNLSGLNTSKVTTMSDMFAYDESLTSLDLSSFDTSNVVDMNYMFGDCRSLTTISGVIDMKSCTKYANMVGGCTKLTGVKIKNPPADFEKQSKLRPSQYTIVS